MTRLFLTQDAIFSTVGKGSVPTEVIGTNGSETVFVTADAAVVFDGSFNRGGDVIDIAGPATLYSASIVGSRLVLTSDSGGSLDIPVGGVGLTLNFAGSAGRLLRFDDTGRVMLGGQVLDSGSEIRLGPSGDANPARVVFWGDSLTASGMPGIFGAIAGVDATSRGVGGEVSTQIAARFAAATALHTEATVIWAGRNNYSDTQTVLNDIAAMVDALPHDNYVVLSILNANTASEYGGGSGRIKIDALNDELADIYGDHFIDVRSVLVDAYDPDIAEDVTDHANEVPPASLRIDNIHQNPRGIALVEAEIYEHSGGPLGFNGGAARSVTEGDAGSNTLTGGAGADILKGHAGSDILHGKGGDNVLVGGGWRRYVRNRRHQSA